MKYSLTRDYRQLIITFRQVISLRYLREIFTLKPLVIPTITLRLDFYSSIPNHPLSNGHQNIPLSY